MTSNPNPVICTICQESPNDARRLPCFHIFCRSCLQNLIRSQSHQTRNKLECPNCRNTTDLQSYGVDAFPRAWIQSTRPSQPRSSEYIQCLDHSSHRLNLFCFRCEEVICKQCRRSNHNEHGTAKLSVVIDQRKKRNREGTSG